MVVAAILASVAVSAAMGQAGGTSGAVTKIKVPVKRYKVLSPADIYQAATQGIRADVRFRDTFSRMTAMPGPARQFELGGVTYLVERAFRTQGDLVCLVPRSSTGALRALFGLTPDWPPTGALPNLPVVFNEGQRITIEGTIVGTVVGEKCVLVYSLMSGEGEPLPAQREVQLFWGAQTEPRIVSEPGENTLVFPCSYVEGKTGTVKVSVKAVGPEELQAELAILTAAREGLGEERKAYGQYLPDSVYRYAGQNRPVNVDFKDNVARQIMGRRFPGEIAVAPAVRGGVWTQVRVGYVFETANRIACLVPRDSANLLARAAGTLPGERVHIRGTTTGLLGAYNCVLVDYIGFPDQEQVVGQGQTWWVSVECPQQQPMVFWDSGLYEIPVPCQNAPGRVERLRVVLREFREVEVPARAGQPAQ